eukprot:TRINITY_DN24_c0_g1_i1.p1 TRINITY_DN24_c0_g1~~TRINITY_DN24_c0_g1_i1.p1  ORF type:complete len:210 (-),score=42.93 TRINITY_DN24_c0_g1_i1:4-633(-)
MYKVLLCCLVILTIGLVSGAQFNLPKNGMSKCLYAEFKADTVVHGSYSMKRDDTRRVLFTVHGPRGALLHVEDDAVEGAFSLEIQNDGEHTLCFNDKAALNVPGSDLSPRRVTIKWDDGEDNVDWAGIAKKENLKPISLVLQQSVKELSSIKSDFKYMRRKEETHRDTSELMNGRIPTLAVFNIIILLAIGFWQITHLKNFFRSRKIMR